MNGWLDQRNVAFFSHAPVWSLENILPQKQQKSELPDSLIGNVQRG